MRTIDKICYLTHETILALSKMDHANVGNVVRGLYNEAYGIYGDDLNTLTFFYISYNFNTPGLSIEIERNNEEFYNHLLNFSIHLSKFYKIPDIIGVYNTFLNYLRNILEQNEIFTISSSELEKYKSKIELYSFNNIEIVQNITREVFFKNLLNTKDEFLLEKDTNYLYLMINQDTGLFKIGHSKDPIYRERTLHSKEPDIKLLKCWKAEKITEKKLHEYYASRRKRGEWFELYTEDIIKFNKLVKTITNNT